MSSLVRIFACFVLLSLASGPQRAFGQNDRDFVFRDEDGHLLLRFVNLPPAGLSTTQRDDVLNSEFSTMVHDHLRADLRFEAEPPDAVWAAAMEPQIDSYLEDRLEGFSSTMVECRAASCRMVLEHTTRYALHEHEIILGEVQRVIQAFLDAHPEDFERAFMIAAYEQQGFLPHIKAFISRTASPSVQTDQPTSD